MRTDIIPALFCLLQCGTALKFLAYSPSFAQLHSHSAFMAKISDILVDAGHEVVMLTEMYDSTMTSKTKKARVIEISSSEKVKKVEKWMSKAIADYFWADKSVYEVFTSWLNLVDIHADQCTKTLSTPGLLDALRAEKFDAAYVESLHNCAPILFHLVGIDKFAATDSAVLSDGSFFYTQTPTNPSYVPSVVGARYGDNLTFFDRLHSTYVHLLATTFRSRITARFEEIVYEKIQGLPPLQDLISRNSLVFTNSEPLFDFPRPSSARIVEIGGVTVSAEHLPVNATWSSILDLRSHTIFISFGTVAKSHLMPDEYKESIVEAIRRFPDVTFIWKYEKPEHNISRGIDNLIETTWAPQRDLLHDPRLAAFISHSGHASILETIYAGVPLIVIPVIGDHYRNAHKIAQSGIGLMLYKQKLSTPYALEHAIREILSTNSYRNRARQVQSMIRERPFTMQEIFVRNMEFLATHGPLRQLDHYGRHLNFIQYYLLDVIAFICVIAFISIIAIIVATRWAISIVLRVLSPKIKHQ